MSPSVLRNVKRFLLAIWMCAMLIVGAGLLAKHAIALPAPAESRHLGDALGALRQPKERGTWLSVHVLYSECRCSQRIVAHLLSSPRPSGLTELVLWTGRSAPSPALTERFRVIRVTSTELARLGIESAPLLVVLDPTNAAMYSGGYTDRKQGPVIDDLRMIAEARSGTVHRVLPVLGCAVSDELKRALTTVPLL